MTGALSPTHWLLILLVVLLLFGAQRLPAAARGLGQSMRIFKAETTALAEERAQEKRVDETPAVASGPTAASAPAPTSGRPANEPAA
ncbi:Sec-independent protein translocase subunit TatA [Actinomycetospora sp. NBRC 106378]|uniref:Sec-independent protein translocase subunit TatA n=1 Tax=Actinomycetospora sp. NBRC 106378 TaxID=3032208 RepID=UPI0024A1BC07|nr:Sec-independent protein translocase subunit TatA [Actinomycetospora sp. NBRC 106378]GLZ55973.1 hypothetical protein Acsp07_55900 [Actinomycetospora sp. NBRC 106378]